MQTINEQVDATSNDDDVDLDVSLDKIQTEAKEVHKLSKNSNNTKVQNSNSINNKTGKFRQDWSINVNTQKSGRKEQYKVIVF